MTDTTDRSLAGTAQHLADIVASSGDAIVAQTFEGTVTCWNAAAERLLGWPAEAILDRSIALVVSDGYLEAEREALGRIRAGTRVQHVETERLHRDGTAVAVFVTFSPVRGPGGELAGVSAIMRDLGVHSAETLPAPAGDRAAHRPAEHRGTTVLLVEDDIDLLELLQATLRAEGLDVIVATDGRAALGLLEMHPEVAAVVSDIVMPNGVSGLLLAREAQRLRPNLPVLLMSGHAPEEIGRLGSTAGFPFLVKPFRTEELTSQVRLLLH